MICAGIDAGSRAIKVVLFDTERAEIVAHGLAEQGVEQQRLAEDLFDRTLQQASLDRAGVSGIVATGYGRNAVRFADTAITEITCHARGVHHLVPEARLIIEIGGQDSKVIWLEEGGRVRDFAMNDRCAAGTGRFLEVLASRLGTDLATLSDLSRRSQRPAAISNTCVVFAETEIIGLLAEGVPPPDIAAGVQNAVAIRAGALVGRSIESPVVFTGGVALLSGMVQALEQALSCALQVAPMPQYTGALGAAILAARQPRGAAFL
jgi:(R)-2-hydroxyacyl-CoA dehydratese activating ATPase